MATSKHFSSITGTATYKYAYGPLPWEEYSDTFLKEGEIASVSHPYRGAAARSGDVGGPFYLNSWKQDVKSQSVSMGGPVRYVGDMYPVSVWRSSIDEFVISPMSAAELTGLGATYMSRVLPTNPNANLAQFLGELREGAPRAFGASLTKANVGRFKAAGDEYLNVEFGWKPFVSDLKAFANAIHNSNRIVENYRKGSDKKIQRRYSAPTKSEERYDLNASFAMPDGTIYLSTDGIHSSTLNERTWFEGAFRYHVPVGDSQLERFARLQSYASRVLGLNLTPELAWELTPWSWFADWFGNFGDVIHNISYLGRDSMVMQYGYVMCHREVVNKMLSNRFTIRPETISVSNVKTHDIKQRLPANPYGFSLAIPDFTTSQIAIMAALGLSRDGTPWSHL